MSRRAILTLSAALTAFALILAGATASVSLRSASTPAVRPAEGVPIDVVRAREAEYRRLIDEANARLRAQQVGVARAQSPEPTRVSARVVENDEEDESHERHERQERHHGHHEDDDG